MNAKQLREIVDNSNISSHKSLKQSIPYNGQIKIYALTCGPNGLLNENT